MTTNTSLPDHKKHIVAGNLLGAARAEADKEMLKSAFVETHDFRALAQTDDFNFVVGRRGTGKTALFIKVAESYSLDSHIFLDKVTPEEYAALSFRSEIEQISNQYQISRAICRVCWKANLLIETIKKLKDHYKLNRSPEADYVRYFAANNRQLLAKDFFERLYEILRAPTNLTKNSQQIPGEIAQAIGLQKLQKAVQQTLQTLNLSSIYLFDGLDEGWIPSKESVAILGGLAIAIADLRDSQTGVYCIVFIRDNIFRSLASVDPDFSRHIEGNTLRLHWNEESLFHLITERLRSALSLEKVENKTKVWNRFAQRNLKGREGFQYCLKFTLYRPRDILVLLNQAFVVAARAGRQEIIEDDVQATSRQIAQDRLTDLVNEYSHVFPGIGIFIKSFKGRPAQIEYQHLVNFLGLMIEENPYSEEQASDLALLGSGTELFNALYSIGFLGLKDQTSSSFLFSHDGARSDLDAIKPDQMTIVHPCYWKALEISDKEIDQTVLVDINDDYKSHTNPEAMELRIRMLGQLVSELPDLPIGSEGASKFEEWVFRVVKMLFAGDLMNPELRPNKASVQRRDIVATNMAERGFWKRILEDYRARQLIFEIKNYEDMEPDDFRQVLSYSGKEYGKFVVMVNRAPNEALPQKERDWIKELYDRHDLLVFVLPVSILVRCVRKLRNPDRRDYADEVFSKRLDTILRSYVALQHQQVKKRGRRRKR